MAKALTNFIIIVSVTRYFYYILIVSIPINITQTHWHLITNVVNNNIVAVKVLTC